jgi:hypothetical protein
MASCVAPAMLPKALKPWKTSLISRVEGSLKCLHLETRGKPEVRVRYDNLIVRRNFETDTKPLQSRDVLPATVNGTDFVTAGVTHLSRWGIP